MRATNIAACLAMSMSALCHAATNPECLNHLGGAFAGVECFNGLANDLKQQNKKLAEEVAASIPNSNRNKGRLKDYLRNQLAARNSCELSRESMTKWVREPAVINPRYHDYDVAYYECVYVLLEAENKFLQNLLKNARQE